MKEIIFSTQFRRDLKKYRNQRGKIDKMMQYVDMLRMEQKIPPQHRPHPLKGRYKDCLECHIEGDLLLINGLVMKEITASAKFRRDIKRYNHQPQKLEKMYRVIDLIASEEPLPEELRLRILPLLQTA